MSLRLVSVAPWGHSRLVLCVGGLAFKLPRINYGWANLLGGLLANMSEAAWRGKEWAGLCPIVWAVPGGWLTVMRRARPLTDVEWLAFDAAAFLVQGEYPLPVEMKQDSFGVLPNGQIVAVDYGN